MGARVVTDAPPILDPAYVRACCHWWARTHARLSSGYSTISPTGRLLADMPSTLCRCLGKNPECLLCAGSGRVSGNIKFETKPKRQRCRAGCVSDAKGIHRLGHDECFRCRGTGWRTILTLSVNPASIRSTVDVGGKYAGNRVYHLIENAVRGWRKTDATVWLNRVLVREYFYNGTQEIKARQLRISHSFYKQRLHEAHVKLEEILRHE